MSYRPVVFEIATTKYEEDRKLVSSIMEELQSLCGVSGGFLFSEPVEKFGWTFFKVLFKGELISGMQEKLGGQIAHSKGKKPDEKFTEFVTKFFESKNYKVRMKIIED